ncbi:hypothetical protein K438DRAFT_2051345 [Mycena galopus ATCC 62051]|nr:hypothetical protein K438DRAFT_2051345 [Mycena galopus ATCC 62051]
MRMGKVPPSAAHVTHVSHCRPCHQGRLLPLCRPQLPPVRKLPPQLPPPLPPPKPKLPPSVAPLPPLQVVLPPPSGAIAAPPAALWSEKFKFNHRFRPRLKFKFDIKQDENNIGPYANLGVFSGGPRTCLGWRFSILEIQVLLCELIGKLSFTLPADSDNIVRAKYAGSLMPTLSSGEKGLMLRVNKIG